MDIHGLKEKIDYLSSILPGLDACYMAIEDENNDNFHRLPVILLDHKPGNVFNICIILSVATTFDNEESDYDFFVRSEIGAYFRYYGDFNLEYDGEVTAYLEEKNYVDAETAFKTVSRILELFNRDPNDDLKFRLFMHSIPVDYHKISYKLTKDFAEVTPFPVIVDAVNDSISMMAGINAEDRSYLAVAFGRSDDLEKLIVTIEENYIESVEMSRASTYLSPEELNHNITYPHYKLLNINNYSVGFSFDLENPDFIVRFLSDYIIYLFPELSAETLIATIEPLVDNIEVAHNLYYLPDGSRPSAEQLSYTKELILCQYEVDRKQ